MVTFSQSDVNAYEARQLAGKASESTANAGCSDESELHEQIRQECLRRGWLAFHGSMAHATYRTEGEPDWIILCSNGKLLLVECKTRKGKLSIAQQAIHAWAGKLGHNVRTIRSIFEFHQVANQLKDNHNDNHE